MNSSNSSGFVDIHSHFLPGLDDGPEEYTQSIAAAQRYQAIGVEQVIATPHWIQGTRWAPSPELVRSRATEAEQRLRAAGVRLRILPGMEISLTDFLCSHFTASDFVSLADTGFFLCEFPLHSALSAPTASGILTLRKKQGDSHCIVAHPERCAMFQDNPARIRELVAAGMLIQVNISSILGHSGRKARQVALELLKEGLVHFLATDSHARFPRMPPDPGEMLELATLIGAETVTAGFRDNPHRLLSGEAATPLQAKIRDRASGHSPPAPKRFIHDILQLFRED